jgi:hypothetical protein
MVYAFFTFLAICLCVEILFTWCESLVFTGLFSNPVSTTKNNIDQIVFINFLAIPCLKEQVYRPTIYKIFLAAVAR